MRKYHTEVHRYMGSIRVYGNWGEDTVNGFGELFTDLFLRSVKNEGYYVMTLLYILHTVTA